jgi:surfactin synthase thioesterase subunit
VSGSPPPSALRVGSDTAMSADGPLVASVERLGGVPPQVIRHPELRMMFEANMAVDIAVRRSYTPTRDSVISVPIVALAGDSDPIAPPKAMEGWARHTTAGFASHEFGGDHFYFRSDPELFRELIVWLLSSIEEPA